MTKKDIVKHAALKTGVSKAVAQAVIDEAIEAVANSLAKGEPIFIRGLFTLSTVKRQEKPARDISKNRQIIVPVHYAPHAKFSSSLRKKIAEANINNKK